MSREILIVIDGPAGAGKSTVARILAQKLGYRYLDTGAIYRVAALRAQEEGIAPEMTEQLRRLCEQITIQFEDTVDGQRVYNEGRDVTEALRTPEMSMLASRISQERVVRECVAGLQRGLGGPGVVAEGRDMGTEIFPHADIKFYLDATVQERGKRRYRELLGRGINIDLPRVIEETTKRDQDDQGRDIAPLRMAEDSVYIDSTGMSREEVVNMMLREIEKRW